MKQNQHGILIFADENRDGKYDATEDSALRTVTLNGPNISANNKMSVKTEIAILQVLFVVHHHPICLFFYLMVHLVIEKQQLLHLLQVIMRGFVNQYEFGSKICSFSR